VSYKQELAYPLVINIPPEQLTS